MSVEVRRATERDCALMPAFRREMEGGAFLAELRDENYYRYKYLAYGRAFVARAGDRLVGITAATPRRVRIGDATCDAAEMGDLFIHPEHRGRGLFRAVHDAVVDSLAADGVGLLTVRAGRGAADHMRQAFGYRRLFGVAEMVAALTPEGTAGLPFGRVPLLRSFLPRARPGPGPGIEGVSPADLAPEAGEETRIAVVRDGDRIRDRYAADPSPYEGVAEGGAAVLLVSGDKGFVVDQWGGEDERALADAAIRRLTDLGAHVVHFWRAEREDPFSRALRGAGLRVVRRKKAVLARVLDDALPALPPPDRWTFRMGDTDGI
jgi:GNAT superfamily N-acetyltransferase